MIPPRTFALVTILLLVRPVLGEVVINEIFYHAPDDLTDLQWIELLNDSDQPADLSGWHLGKTVQFSFPNGSSIAPHGYLVLCKDREQFQHFYSVPLAGQFEGSFKKGEGHLELRDRTGHVVDRVDFTDRAPWPRGAAGHTASLERISPGAAGNLPDNWVDSPLSDDDTKPGGSPGVRNSAFSATLPPIINNVTFRPARVQAGEPIEVQAHLSTQAAIKDVAVLYRSVEPGAESEEKSVPMKPIGAEGQYSAIIPGQKAGQIVRFRVQATDANSAQRLYPSATDLHPALSCLILTNFPKSKIPIGLIIHPDAAEVASSKQQGQNGGMPFNPEGQARFMVQMVLDNQLDLPSLWTALTLSNTIAADTMEQLRTLFAAKMREREQLRERTMAANDVQKAAQQLPESIQPFKVKFGEELKPLLRPEQVKLFEQWQKAAPSGGDPMGGDPSMMLRRFIRLEPGYMHLSLNTNINPSQLASVRNVYQGAIRDREALVPQLRKLMAGPRNEDSPEGEDLQGKAMAIEPGVDQKLRAVLTPAQAREFGAWRMADVPAFMRKGGPKASEPAVGRSAFVYVDPKNGEPQLYDFVHIPNRSGGWKVHFGKDASLNGMTGIDLIFESSERWIFAEPFAYELHHRAGLAAPLTDFVRLSVDGQPLGFYLLIEQPNKAFLRRNGLREDGNLYKANWAGRGIAGQNEKRTNVHGTHDDLLQLIDQLDSTKGNPAEQWKIIQRQLNVEEVLNHYAVRMLISDWDGFFNNYYLYHDLHGTGKWIFFPWDEDKTWGEYDGWDNRPLYDMPLSYGSDGDRPPGSRPGAPAPRGINGGSWWRPGGYISRPVLSNPQFRKLFLARIKDLLNTEFKDDRLFPYLDAMKERLADEVRVRAEAQHENPERAQQQFNADFASLKEFVTKRRQWLLDQEEIRGAEPYDRSQIASTAPAEKHSKKPKKAK